MRRRGAGLFNNSLKTDSFVFRGFSFPGDCCLTKALSNNEALILDHLSIYREQELFPSRSITEQDGKVVAHGCYVFCPKLPCEPFVEISKELQKLNDYCLAQYKAVSSESQISKETWGDLNDDFFAENYEFQIAKWDHHLAVTVKIVPILLICSFLEWALLKLLNQYAGQKKYPQIKGKSKINSYLAYLEQASCYVSNLDDSSITLLERIRKTRNDYAHGEIESVAENLTGLKIGSIIKLVSTIMMNCEQNCVYK